MNIITKAYGSTVYGVEAQIISIEVNIISGTKFFIVGLPDSAIKESEHRIESVLKELKRRMPRQRVIVNLAPASMRKEGAAYDLPIALSVLHASGQEVLPDLDRYVIMGELALDGYLRPIRGVLPIAIEARKRKFKGFILPKANAHEAAIVNDLDVIPVEHIKEAIDFLGKRRDIPPLKSDTRKLFEVVLDDYSMDFSDVKGQASVKRSLEVAAAGGHNILMVGPPGAGKTMLARRIPSILPPLTLQESLETSKIYSVIGKLAQHESLVTQRPFQAPHHTISDVALVGGGSIPQPGQISLAHNGVLFLDELPEFKRSTLEVLRQPIEEKFINITRARLSVCFPANFMLVISMNPCPCGYYTHARKKCTCTPLIRKRYMGKISGPLLDRIDIQMPVNALSMEELEQFPPTPSSREIRARVTVARERQKERFAQYDKIHNNQMLPPQLIEKLCPMPEATKGLLKRVMESFNLSARAYNSIRKVSRTIADLGGHEHITEEHVSEAVIYRSLDREQWGD